MSFFTSRTLEVLPLFVLLCTTVTTAGEDLLYGKLNRVTLGGATVLGSGYNLVYGNPHLISLSHDHDQSGSDPGYAGEVYQVSWLKQGYVADQVNFTNYGSCRGEIYREAVPGMFFYQQLLLANIFTESSPGEQCRRTRYGEDYDGDLAVTRSGKKCVEWKQVHDNKFRKFHTEDAILAMRNYCRNPDWSDGGPWCVTQTDGGDKYEWEYCHVPFCRPTITSDAIRYSAFLGQTRSSYRSSPRDAEVHYEIHSACKLGRATFDTEKAELSGALVRQICALPEDYVEEDYMRVIDTYGTHVVTSAELGVVNVERRTMSRAALTDYVLKSPKVKSHFIDDVEYFGMKLTEISELSLAEAMSDNKKLIEVKIGAYDHGNINLRPVNHRLMPIEQILNSPQWSEGCTTTTGCCEKTKTFKQNLLKALNYYTGYKRVYKTKKADPLIGVRATWPTGAYVLPGLVQTPRCPRDDWLMSRLTINNKYNAYMAEVGVNGFASVIANSFPFGRKRSVYNMYEEKTDEWHLKVCTKSKANPSGSYQYYWPDGHYCLLRRGGTCMQDFEEGFVSWNDNRKPKTRGQSLPDFKTYTAGKTRLFFCCKKNKNNYNGEIQLPTSRTFYLIKIGRACQKVRGMKAESLQTPRVCPTNVCLQLETFRGAMTSEEKSAVQHPAICKYMRIPEDDEARFQKVYQGFKPDYTIRGTFMDLVARLAENYGFGMK